MGRKKSQVSGAAPARGRPPKGGRPKAGAGAQKQKTRKKPSGTSTKIVRRRFTPEEKRIAVEAYLKSGLSMSEFGRLWDLSSSTMSKWVRSYEQDGG